MKAMLDDDKLNWRDLTGLKENPSNYEGEIFYNPAGSYISRVYSEGGENVNVVDMYEDRSDINRALITPEDGRIFIALKSLIMLGADKVPEVFKNELCRDYYEMRITVKDYAAMMYALMKEEYGNKEPNGIVYHEPPTPG